MAQTVESACDAADPGSTPQSGRPPGEGHGIPLQCSCLEEPMHRGPWQPAVHGGQGGACDGAAGTHACSCACVGPRFRTGTVCCGEQTLALALGLSRGADSRASGLSGYGCSTASGIMSCPTRNHVPCTAQWIVNQWTTREVCVICILSQVSRT